ncbi:hypothetical protein EFK50_16285 [Nocardioides marmoriginsengisoli]|uniref:Uncharacterized protein n=1 Tax=Nocardioides marmoriginsengisoli TaxID=661483 RepID=A0A3N0CIT8_9ACTN|nr:hypothetical protein [Nocardioides marmoriginsengisoli]RNL63249.1 hypothetical protein EFK50_16285 [Nocardioides marmoriginsengisoli]
MVIVDRLLAWLRTGPGYVPTRWSLLRIAIVTVVALVVAGMVLPGKISTIDDGKYNGLATKTTRNIALPFGDTRGFRPTDRPNSFRVAWVGGSELLGKGLGKRAFIPGVAAKEIGRVGGKPISTDIYYMDAIRLTDELSALTSAVASKPDLVVVSLNPVWVMNDLAVQQWGYLDGNLALHSVDKPALWPVVASLVSPGDAGWKVLSGISGVVNDRYDWGVDLTEKTAGWSFLHEIKDAKPPELSKLAQLGLRRPVDFFFGESQEVEDAAGDVTAAQFAILAREVASRSSFNRTVLRAMMDVVDRAGVDAYFYMPPINAEFYQHPEAKRYVDQVRAMLAEASEGRTNAHLFLDPQGLQDRVPETEYEDIVHVLDPKPEAGVLADDLCKLLKSWNRDPTCEGR